MGWSGEDKERIRAMWQDEGLSASQIARTMGNTTRNAIIGVIHRNNWQNTSKPGRPTRVHYARTPKAPKEESLPRLLSKNRQAILQETGGMELYGPLEDFPASGMCKYIPGDPTRHGWRCCGYPAGDLARHPQGDRTKPWCQAHEVVVLPPKGAQYTGTPHNPTANYVTQCTDKLRFNSNQPRAAVLSQDMDAA